MNTKSPFGAEPHYDVVVIGGGITGAGVAREAAAAGLKTLLVEQRDYAWGTSSRSSKMIHGGLRYLARGQVGLTRQAVAERQRMLTQAPGLVDRMRYVVPHYRRGFPGPRLLAAVLWLYDRFAGEHTRQTIAPIEIRQWVPGLDTHHLKSASAFSDAVTDDARLVLRILAEARALGAVTRNYVRASKVEKPEDAPWTVTLHDQRGSNQARTVTTTLVVNATGAWADRLWRTHHGQEHIRPLRGSHIVLPFERLPVSICLTLAHPRDQRPVFVFPWLGRTVVGTTDLDHTESLDKEPRITGEEVSYLLEVVGRAFPEAMAGPADIVSTWAGVRPVVSQKGGRAPSDESREHVIWDEGGLVSVAGGKLTTFRLIAREVLLVGAPRLNQLVLQDEDAPLFKAAPAMARPEAVPQLTWQRLQGQYGPALVAVLKSGPLKAIPGSGYLWCELHWSARHESVVHLDDLLLRRTRLGLVLNDGAASLLPDIRKNLAEELNWSEQRWRGEIKRYLEVWADAYAPPHDA